MKRNDSRLRFVYTIFIIAALAVIANVVIVIVGHVHVRSMTSLDPYIQSVSLVNETVFANRGTIYDAGGEAVAQDEETYDIICYLDSSRLGNKNQVAYVDDPLYTSQVLAGILDMDQEEIYYYLTSNPNLYQTELGPKGRNLSAETVEEIKNYPNLHGIGFRTSYKRNYPQGQTIAPYLVGFAQSDDSGKLVGKMGLEYYLDSELSGTDGYHVYQQDKNGYVLPGMYEESTPASDGYDVYLTLDSSIQEALEVSFNDIVEQNNASKAWAAVVEINSGKILAWGQTPSFNPNELEFEDYNNYGSQVAYEPGSVMKSFIYATAIDTGVYNGTATFDSSPFCYYSNGLEPYRVYDGTSYGCIHNAADHNWGTIEFDYGLIYSSNVATSTLLTYVGSDTYLDYLDKFGFFKPVDTDGIVEEPGVLNYTYPSEKLSLTYGQGSSVTMLQLLQAYTAIFGNGEMVKPYFIDKIIDSDNGTVIYQGSRKVVSTPIKESTADQMQDILRRVVSDPGGTAQFYAIDEVDIIAKTGTSELVENGSYSSDDSLTSVMLAFPYEDPQYMIYYAYRSPYDYNNHVYSEPITNFIKKVAILTKTGYNKNENQVNNPIVKSEMPNITGMTYQSATGILNQYDVNIIKIGNGENVVGQYPLTGDDVYTSEKVMILTDGDSISLPDFTGWTRKEIINYWNLSGIPFALDGYGVVYEQSLPVGTIVNSSSEVVVKLKNIETNIDTSKKKDEDEKSVDDEYYEEDEE